ncbi:hypothetical protein O181_004639 [Austropuccinia psidii MF-1]|uniref:MYND-type domain-containing protein n=1 Tax=Austropuccinia psidii MF-1 TaxID=1389203 RepID=A0A9Q3BG62_9BASI|nr:hypothetical protein [Austropuccinia psidii MF-1]
MRESNFYFPAHNKASVSITSALYDRRAIDATSPLPLLSTLTHLSYLTSTSPRIREILCSDGGLERLISILRLTVRKMREHRQNLHGPSNLHHQQIGSNHLNHPSSSSSSTIYFSSDSSLSLNPFYSSIYPHQSNHPSSHHQSNQFNSSSSSHSNQSNPFLSSSRALIQSSPFRPFVSSQSVQTSSPSTNHQPISVINNNLNSQTHPSSPTFGLSKEQKQLLWTWSLSFQCVVNIGVRGTESIRTRVVEAGIVPIIISVLGGYLYEMERFRQQSENRLKLQQNSNLDSNLSSSITSTSLTFSSTPTTRPPTPINLDQPPRPVLSSRTLAQPTPPSPLNFQNPSSLNQSNQSSSSHHQPHPLPSYPHLNQPHSSSIITSNSNYFNNQSTSTSLPIQPNQSSHHRLDVRHSAPGSLTIHELSHPININSSNESTFRTGSISPSSVSSSSSLETSQLVNIQHAIIPTVTSDNLPDSINSTLSTISDSNHLINLHDHHQNQSSTQTDHQSSISRPSVIDDGDDHSLADESEGDVMMDLVGSSNQAGPSSTRQRSRRGTIKASQSNPHSVFSITPIVPSRPTVTELNEDEPSNPNSETDAGPMEGLESFDSNQISNNVTSPPTSTTALFTNNHQTPKASASRLPPSNSTQSLTQINPLQSSSNHQHQQHSINHPVIDNLTQSINQAPNSIDSTRHNSNQDLLPPRGPRLGASPPNGQADDAILPRVLSDTEGTTPTGEFTPRRQHQPQNLVNIPITVTNLGTQTTETTFPTRPTPPNSIPSTTTSPVNLNFRDEDVLLALQLLAYLSKYAHVRAYFHEPASRATLELTYGSLHEATRALSRFTGRFKSDRHDRERGKDVANFINQSLNRRPVSAQGHQTLNGSSTSSLVNEYSDHYRRVLHQPHRSLSSSIMQDRLSRPELTFEHLGVSYGNRLTSTENSNDSTHSRMFLDGATLFSTTPLPTTFPQPTHQPSFVLGQNGNSPLPIVGIGTPKHSQTNPQHQHHSHHLSLGPFNHHDNNLSHPSRTYLSSSNIGTHLNHPLPAINPLASNVFSYVERFTHERLPTDIHSPSIPSEIQYWAGVIMRNACRKDDDRGGIRQCANMQCGRWESFPREFAKCRRCRKAKYCSKDCQSKAWQLGHRFWCCNKTEGETNTIAVGSSVENERNHQSSGDITIGDNHGDGDIDRRDEEAREGRTLVDAAIERLRREGTELTMQLGRATREAAEVNSNIATPPDRELRVSHAFDVNDRREGLAGRNGEREAADRTRNDGPRFGGVIDEVDERDRIRLMVETGEE